MFIPKLSKINEELLDASEKGDLESVRRLLSNKHIDINCKRI